MIQALYIYHAFLSNISTQIYQPQEQHEHKEYIINLYDFETGQKAAWNIRHLNNNHLLLVEFSIDFKSFNKQISVLKTMKVKNRSNPFMIKD